MLYLALKSGMNTEAENSENHSVSRMLCSFSRIPMSLALYRDTKLSLRSQAHLGFYDTCICGISMLVYFALSAELPARYPTNASTFWQSIRFRVPWHCQSVVEHVSLRLNFNQFPRKIINE